MHTIQVRITDEEYAKVNELRKSGVNVMVLLKNHLLEMLKNETTVVINNVAKE